MPVGNAAVCVPKPWLPQGCVHEEDFPGNPLSLHSCTGPSGVAWKSTETLMRQVGCVCVHVCESSVLKHF